MKIKIIILTIFLGLNLKLYAGELQSLKIKEKEPAFTVNIEKIYNHYGKSKELRNRFLNSIDIAQKKILVMIKEGQYIVEDYQRLLNQSKNNLINQDINQELIKKIKNLEQKIRKQEILVNKFRQKTDLELTNKRRSLINSNLKDIKNKINNILENKNYKILFIENKTNLSFSSNTLDITEELNNSLNKLS